MSLLKNIQKLFKNSNKNATSTVLTDEWLLPVDLLQTKKLLHTKSMNFRVYQAENGMVLEFFELNRNSRGHKFNLYIVNSYEELGAKLANIIVYDKIRR